MKSRLLDMLRLPLLPNFLRWADNKAFPINELTEAEIKELGRRWTQALLDRKREAKNHKP